MVVVLVMSVRVSRLLSLLLSSRCGCEEGLLEAMVFASEGSDAMIAVLFFGAEDGAAALLRQGEAAAATAMEAPSSAFLQMED